MWTMTPKPTKPKGRYDRQDGNGRRWIIITYERRLKLWRWIEKEKQQNPARGAYTINGAMSKLLGDAIDGIVE